MSFAILLVGLSNKTGSASMTETQRQQQIAELRALQQSNPRDLIDQYCQLTGQIGGNQMPNGASFGRMIDTIISLRAATESATTATS
jgi:hypothetical protein